MNKIKLVLTLAIISISISINAQKYGHINTEELITSLPEVKTANDVIEAMKDSLTMEAQKMVQSLQAKYKDLEARVNDIAPKQLEIEKQQLQAEEQQLQTFDQQSQQAIFEKSERILGPIQEKINKAIIEVASEGGYTYIFDTSVGNILYMDETLDVSSLVKSKL